jgi:hypothetical protein
MVKAGLLEPYLRELGKVPHRQDRIGCARWFVKDRVTRTKVTPSRQTAMSSVPESREPKCEHVVKGNYGIT